MRIGQMIAASVLKGIEAKLELDNPEELKVGYPIIVEGKKYDFYCVVRDIYSPNVELIERIAGHNVPGLLPLSAHGDAHKFTKTSLKPIQLITKDGQLLEPETIPPYLATVRKAVKEDVEKLYKPTSASLHIGTLRGVPEFNIPLEFDKLTEKPFAIFGRTGVGKSILCKIICNSILEKDASAVLIFDMHQEYGIFSKTDNTPGLQYFFPDKVESFTLDYGNKSAKPFIVDVRQIRPDDLIIALQDLSQPMIDALYIINRQRARDVDLVTAIEDAAPEYYESAHPSALQALQRRISRLDRLEFVREGEDAFNQICSLLKAKKSIVLDFGRYGKDATAYLFIANILARRLYREYTERSYPRLVLFLEEAHKFLAPEIIDHTIFGRLARETRKFNLILALIDQRPSRIDEEVRSQLANRLTLSLKEPSDTQAALAGVSDRAVWSDIVGTIPSRTLLVLGDAIRVPTVIDVLHYSTKAGYGNVDRSKIEALAAKSEQIFQP